MKSTSSESLVLRGAEAAAASAVDAGSDLRSGTWTRLGAGSVRGDEVTERSLAGLAGKAERAARAQGYAAGWAEGRRRATESAADLLAERGRVQDAEHQQVVAGQRAAATALATALDQVAEALADTQEVLASHAVEMALQIAAAVLQREVLTATDPGADALVRALVSVPPAVPVTVRINPADQAVLDLSVLDGRPAVRRRRPDPVPRRRRRGDRGAGRRRQHRRRPGAGPRGAPPVTATTVRDDVLAAALSAARPVAYGRLVELKGLHLLAAGVDAAVGDLVVVEGNDATEVPAEVIASSPAGTVCLPLGSTHGLRVGARVRRHRRPAARRRSAPS